MRVLPAIFAHARQVSLDVTRIARGMIKRRIEQLNQSQVTLYQPVVHRVHGRPPAFGDSNPAEDGPALRQAIDLTLGVGSGAERLAIVKESAPIPTAVPRVSFNVI